MTKTSRKRILINLELCYRLVLVGRDRDELRFRKHAARYMTSSLVLVTGLIVGGHQ